MPYIRFKRDVIFVYIPKYEDVMKWAKTRMYIVSR